MAPNATNNKRPLENAGQSAFQPKRRFMQVQEDTETHVASGFNRFRGIRVLPDDTPASPMNVEGYERNWDESEPSNEEVIRILGDDNSRSSEEAYKEFFGEFSDEEFVRGISDALKFKKELDMLEEARKMFEEPSEEVEAPRLRGPVFARNAFKRVEKGIMKKNKEEPKKEPEAMKHEDSYDEVGGQEEKSDANVAVYVNAESMDVAGEEIAEEEVIEDGIVYMDTHFEVLHEEQVIEEDGVYFDTHFVVAVEEEVITSD